MENDIITKELLEPKSCDTCNRCPDYDEECVKVEDHFTCYIGINGEGINIGIADGFCPFLQNPTTP